MSNPATLQEPATQERTFIAEIYMPDLPNQVEVTFWYQERNNRVIVGGFETQLDSTQWDEQIKEEIERCFNQKSVEFK